jgi:hypothetical protein
MSKVVPIKNEEQEIEKVTLTDERRTAALKAGQMKLSAVALLGTAGEVVLPPEVPLLAPDPVAPAREMTVAKVELSSTVSDPDSTEV